MLIIYANYDDLQSLHIHLLLVVAFATAHATHVQLHRVVGTGHCVAGTGHCVAGSL